MPQFTVYEQGYHQGLEDVDVPGATPAPSFLSDRLKRNWLAGYRDAPRGVFLERENQLHENFIRGGG